MNLDWGNLIIALLETLVDIVWVQLPTMLSDVMISIIDKLIWLFTTQEGLQSLANFGKALAEGLINGLISGIESGVNGVIKIINEVLGGISKAWTWAGIPEIPDIPTISIPRVKFAKGGMFDDIGTTFLAQAGESGAEIVHTGSRGTGVANVEQISDAQYMALEKYDLEAIINRAAANVVNGIITGLRMTSNNNSGGDVIVKLGEREFKSYIVQTVNDTLRAQGRKSLDTVTAYGGK